MVMNMATMRASQPAFEDILRARLATPEAASYDDQVALNQGFRFHWDRLDPGLNAKPYWPHDPRAGILHFHGPKLAGIEAIAAGHWNWADPVARTIGALCDAHIPHYIAWLTDLAERLQTIDPATTFRLHQLAGALAARATSPEAHDLSFMGFRMFPE